jgi:hypothetical protein
MVVEIVAMMEAVIIAMVEKMMEIKVMEAVAVVGENKNLGRQQRSTKLIIMRNPVSFPFILCF